MKIVFVADLELPSTAVGSFRILDTAKNFAKEHEVSIICRRNGKNIAGLNIIPQPRPSFTRFPFFALKEIKKIAPDVVIVSTPPLNSLFLIPRLRKPIKVIADVRDMSSIKRKAVPYPLIYYLTAKFFERTLLRRADKVVVVVPIFFPYFKNPIWIPNGTDFNLFKPTQEKKKRQILYAGSVSNYHLPKFIADTIQLTCKKDQNVSFLFIGGGDRMDWLKSEIAKRGLTSRVIFKPAVPREQLPKIINESAAAMGTMDKVYIGLPVKMIDALACNVPVVTNLDDHKTKFALPVRVGKTPEEYSNQLIQALNSDPKNINTRKQIESTYSRKALSEKYKDVLNS